MRTFLLIAITLISFSAFSQGIEFFHGTWQEGIEEAKKQEKIIFVDAYTTWCGPCKRMAKYVFTEDEAGEFFNSNFINLKIDMEKTNGREFGARYPVSAYPTLFFLDTNGKMLKKSVGGKQLKDLIALGNSILSEFDFSAKYREAYENGDRSFDNVTNYIDGLNKSGKSSLKIANEFWDENPDLTEEQKTEFLFKASSEVDSKLFEEMISRKSAVIKQFGLEAFKEQIKLAGNNTVDKAIKYEDEGLMKSAIKTVKKLDKKTGKDLLAEASLKWAYAQSDSKEVLKASKKLLKNDLSFDETMNWAKEILSVFPKEKDVREYVYKVISKPMEKATTRDHISLYSKLLLDMEKESEALAYAKNALERTDDKNITRYLESLIKYIENSNS